MSKKPTEPRASRVAAGHTQREAAALADINLRTWQDWEHGRFTIPAHTLRLYRHLAGLERIPFRSAVGQEA